jgi:N-acyl-D-aspartate/D-glutamate deacylase
MSPRRLILALLMLACLFGGRLAWGQVVNADVLLQGGLIYVGDMSPPSTGDVAIRGDKIVAVGDFQRGDIGRVLDCRGLIISPGFIDLHNHSDRQVVARETRAVANYLTQGCTTIVTGNCGSGPIDVEAYYAKIDAFGAGVNVAHLLPQGQLRRKVIGETRRAASEDEMVKMQLLADKAMFDGAWGMSTGLIYVPSSYANTEELAAIATVVGKHGGIYASHIRNENTGLLDAVNEALSIGKQANTPVHISHFKSSGKNSWGLVRVAVDLIQKQRDAGQTVTADQYPYTASSTSLNATMIPAWARAGGAKQLRERLVDKKDGPRIREAIINKLKQTDQGQRIQIASYRKRPEWIGKRLNQIADAESQQPIEIVLDIVRNGGAAVVNHSINEDDVRFVMAQPWVATASDGSSRLPAATAPHPRSYGTFPRKIGHYAVREKAIEIGVAIRSASGLPADILGLPKRGYLKPEYFADVIVWDKDEIIDTATFDSPHQYAVGMKYVFVNGGAAIHNGRMTGALFGRSLQKRVDR